MEQNNIIRFSNRTDWDPSPNKLSLELDRLKLEGKPILDLTLTNPTSAGLSYLDDATLGPLLDQRALSYEPDPKGLLSAREAVAAYYAQKNIRVSPEDIVLTASTSEAYSLILRLLCNPADRVLVPRPSYPLFDYLCDLNDVYPDRYRLFYDGQRWRADLAYLEEHFYNTRALILVNPNNPTGSSPDGAERVGILRLCAREGAALIADEVFLDFALDPARRLVSLAGSMQTLTFALGGVSKCAGLPQMKLAWIVLSGPEKLKTEALRRLEIIADTYLSPSAPAQQALPVWLERRSGFQAQILERVRTNLALLRRILAEEAPGTEVLECEGGWSVTLRAKACFDDEQFVVELLRRHQVHLHPGYFYEFEGGNHLVVSLLPQADIFTEAVRRLARALGGKA